MVINEGAKVDMTGSKSELTINSLDIWNGQINQTAGTLTVLNDDYTRTTGYLTSDGGNIIIGHIGDPTAPSDPDVAGTLILNNTLDSITAATAVTINTNGKLAQSAGNVVLDNTNDNWNGAIELSGTGNLTLSGRADSTDATQTYNQTGGNLIIDNGGSLTLNTDTTGATPVSSAITGGTVQLGEAGNTAGTLVVNNGLTTNQAKVVTAGTNASNAFSVKGANTAFTTLTDTNFATGSVTVGDGTTNASVLNLSNNAIIAKEVALTVAENSTMNVADTAQTTINELDTWNGTINQTAGTITVLDNVVKNATTAKLTSNGGNIIIGHIGDPTDPSDPDIAGTLNLNNTLDSIAAATAVTINTNGTLKQSAGTVALNASGTGADTWNGAIDLSGTGNLTVSGFNKTTDGTVTYNQTGGKAKFDGTTLVLDPDTTKKSVISDGSVELTNGSTLTINNGENNNNAAVTMAAGTETMNVTGNSTMTLDSYIYGPTSAAPQLIETAISAGTLNVGDSADNTDHSTLEVASGTIAQAANVAINEGSALNITGADAQDAGTAPAIVAAVTLDSTDTWNGDINMSNAGTADDENISLTLNDIAITVGADPTFDNTGSSPYYSQTGGALILNNTSLSMEDATLINAPSGSMTLDTDSHFESQSGRFIVGDLQNAGVIHSINTGYENHLFDNHIIGDGAGDEKAEYTIDLYARSNANKNYDQFGKDSTSISATDLSTKHGIIHVSDWTLNGDIYGYDAPIDRSIAIDKLFKGSVAANHTIDFTSTDKEVFTPIGWYGLHSKGGGNYSFDLNRYNPGVFRGQVSTLAQYQNQLAIDDMIFNHTMVDQGFKGNDYIASNPNRLASANDLYPPYEYSRKDGGLWVKMYGNFERLHAGGLDVGNNAYGTIIGADFGLKELKHGWQFMPTAYIGYNGAHQYWNGYGAYQNGGQLGVMGTWYKNDFMIGAMAYGGVYGNEMSTPRGDDNAFNYFAGSAVKGAYNWKFAKNWALQPNLFVSYNYFGQQNWHSDFGQMGMMSGALNGINIAPGLNLIYERETWSAYVTLQYMYNINQATGGRAGNVDLPRLSMDRGYIQYGIGLNKKFTDRFSAYIQTVIRNVGRNGIGLQAGFQWRFGKCGSNSGKGNITPELKKTNITLSGNKVQ
ncbi:hypothetical protein J6P92_06395 [bacterium]|nr:hypothetical protein [bacterium]